MTDLSTVLPDFPGHLYTNLIPSLEKSHLTVTDLITLDVVEVAKRAHLPLLPLKKLCDHILKSLQADFDDGSSEEVGKAREPRASLYTAGPEFVKQWSTISLLDEAMDEALGGGIPTGCITEITGESGAGKTQFLLTLLLACQLPPPHGLSRSALYISTEAALPTTRLKQMLTHHPVLTSYEPSPSLDRVISIVTPDLETQDHILRFQVPVAIERYDVGLIIIDSIAANYRAEFERPGANRNGANMAKRSAELIKLGSLLRSYARTHNIAVIVSNQVSDRFSPLGPTFETPSTQHAKLQHLPPQQSQQSPLANRSTMHSRPQIPSSSLPSSSAPNYRSTEPSPMKLDHQQRWFTGWGDDADRFSFTDPGFQMMPQKTPTLGLVWTNQIAARLVLLKTPVYGISLKGEGEEDDREQVLKRWKRYFKVVFAGWTKPSGAGIEGAVEFGILREGIRAVGEAEGEKAVDDRIPARE